MYLNKLFKLYYWLFLFIFFNCHSSQNQSFSQLESALINWYYKYNPTVATEHNLVNYRTQLEKFDSNSIEEYKADINRFMIELSQIDEIKLKNPDVIIVDPTNELYASGKDKYFYKDGIHLTAHGNEIIANKIFKSIKNLL